VSETTVTVNHPDPDAGPNDPPIYEGAPASAWKWLIPGRYPCTYTTAPDSEPTAATLVVTDSEASHLEHNEDDDAWFIVQYDRMNPTVLDRAGLYRHVLRVVEARAYGYDDGTDVPVWRWVGDGTLEPLTIRTVTPADKFDDDDYARGTYAVEDASGKRYVTTTVRIDGRA
jgi:hypothetical protein